MKDILTKRDHAVLAAKSVISQLPKLGLMKKPCYHPDGLSFLVAVKDDEAWIKPCLLSILDVADEIIVVDSSVRDNTTKIVQALAEANKKIKHLKFYWSGYNAFALSLHIGLQCASFKWVFKWDSDQVAKSTEALNIWVQRLKRLDPNRFYVIDFARVQLEGDLKHQPKAMPFGGYEGRLFTWKPELRWGLKNNSYECISGDTIWGQRFPPYFQNLRWHEPFIYHCNIKTPRQRLTRLFWNDYMVNKETSFASLEDYTAFRVQKDWGLTLSEAEKKMSENSFDGLVSYDESTFGSLPEILAQTIAHNQKRMVTEGTTSSPTFDGEQLEVSK